MSKLVYLYEQMSKISKNNRKATLNLIDERVNEGTERVYNAIRALEQKMDLRFDEMDKRLTLITWMIGILAAIFVAHIFKS